MITTLNIIKMLVFAIAVFSTALAINHIVVYIFDLIRYYNNKIEHVYLSWWFYILTVITSICWYLVFKM